MDVEQNLKGGEEATRQAGVADPGDEAAAAKLWAVYISEAEKYDKGLVESWKSDMEGMLIFAGLFSASLTAFLIESYKTLNQLEASANGSTFSITPLIDISFTPTTASVVCNALWFISLGLSLTCALIATLLEQWARDFLHRTEIRSAPLIRARIFSYLYYGIKRFNMHTVVEIIPLLLHASLFFFFSGLIAFLFHVNLTITIIATLILLFVTATYSVLTFLPLRYFDCPYRTPLSGVFWRLLHTYGTIWDQSNVQPNTSPDKSMVEAMSRSAMDTSRERMVRDGRALIWTVKSLSDDSELEAFVEAIPDVLWRSRSQRYSYADHIRELIQNSDVRLCERIENHLRSCDTGILSSAARKRRLIASYKALWAIATLFHPRQFPDQPPLDFSRWTRFFQSEEDASILHYSLSAQVLMQWSLFSANETRATGMLPYLAKCRMDIEHGHEPDKRPIVAFLNEFPWVHPVPFRVRKAPKRKLTLDVISDIESMIETYRCNIRFQYLENAAGLDSIPYRWRETRQLIELPEFDFRKSQTALELTLNRIVHNQLHKFNNESGRWIEDIIQELCRLWTPAASSTTVIPPGIVRYLNEGITAELTLSWGGGISFLYLEEQLLTALWRLASFSSPFATDLALYSSVLDALTKSGCFAISISLGMLVKAKMYASLDLAWTDENWQSRFSHSLLPTETAVIASPKLADANTLTYDGKSSIASKTPRSDRWSPELRAKLLGARISEGGIDLVAQFLEFCCSDPFPYKAAETLQKMDIFLLPVSVHDVHQNRLAQAIAKLFESPRGAEALPSVINLKIFDTYAHLNAPVPNWGPYVPWLTSPHARYNIKAAFFAFIQTMSNASLNDSTSLSIPDTDFAEANECKKQDSRTETPTPAVNP
ncbi:hypothetical protein MVEN_01853700 [Mycena venus]|uniref:DUF6535 domain-containing protein n=1 Tax=Mycena venus TaxID=2733690 RepID=A0A8H7CMB0_9AGAR|nr:hypothetical protein MVEN_01853700 [Mycena venus]